jgi:glutamate-1-semialdehyde 2,1-aminomutase
MDVSSSASLAARLAALTPGGAHTLAKGDDQFPDGLAPVIDRGSGCRVWDADGNEYIEYGAGLRSVTLGHAFPPVVEAVAGELGRGSNFVRPSAIEVRAAEALLDCVGADQMAKFAKNGSDVTTAAVRLARAWTGRDLVAVCRDSTFLSTDDWFIGTTAMAAGIPQVVRDLTVAFRYNDPASIEALFDEYPGRIACLVLDPASPLHEPRDGFLAVARDIAHRHGALIVFDEMITGFRWHLGGAQAVYGVRPDLSCFGKGMANGFAVSALVGRRDVMELGGLDPAGERVFLLSTTHGAETHGLAAAIATMDVYRSEPVIEHLYRQGERLAVGVRQAAEAAGVADHFRVIGRSCNLVYSTLGPDGAPSQAFRTLFLQETIRRGVLAPSLVVSYSHAEADIDRTVEVVAEALPVYRRALDEGIDRHLVGRPVRPVMSPSRNAGRVG